MVLERARGCRWWCAALRCRRPPAALRPPQHNLAHPRAGGDDQLLESDGVSCRGGQALGGHVDGSDARASEEGDALLLIPGWLLAGAAAADARVEAGQAGGALGEQVGLAQRGALVGNDLRGGS